MPVRHVRQIVTKQDAALRWDRGSIVLTRYNMPTSIMLDEAGAYTHAREVCARFRTKAQKQHVEARDAGKIGAIYLKKRCLSAGRGHKQARAGQQNTVLKARIARTD
jgi:hypothetical protein